ncbi:MAG: VIT1/CCC1 transporter family protein [Actinomycetota bacterium]|nr:VIT1/CCC1 transporter family protein [Actinomycetota bacterium]
MSKVRELESGGGWFHQHRDVSGGWLRPIVFGAVDGLVTNASLIAGVGGGGVGRQTLILTGLAGLVAGAFSMATGEYISVASQNELMGAEARVERDRLARFPEEESAELQRVFVAYGADPVVAEQVVEAISRDPEVALRVHMREELGLDPSGLPSPLVAAVGSLVSCAVGGLIPLLPFLLGAPSLGLALSIVAIALFAGGEAVGRITGRPLLRSGVRQLALGALAVGVAFAVGRLFGAII